MRKSLQTMNSSCFFIEIFLMYNNNVDYQSKNFSSCPTYTQERMGWVDNYLAFNMVSWGISGIFIAVNCQLPSYFAEDRKFKMNDLVLDIFVLYSVYFFHHFLFLLFMLVFKQCRNEAPWAASPHMHMVSQFICTWICTAKWQLDTAIFD